MLRSRPGDRSLAGPHLSHPTSSPASEPRSAARPGSPGAHTTTRRSTLNLIVSVHPDYVLTHQALPRGPDRSTVHCDLYVECDRLGEVDVSRAVEFWDITNREDYYVVELQQQGTRSRSWVAGRYSNQEASVHAFEIMVADRYANDGSRTVRGWRTQTASERRASERRASHRRRATRPLGATGGRG
jgi:Ring hydroxylating alpha subunit (catalytic domain)